MSSHTLNNFEKQVRSLEEAKNFKEIANKFYEEHDYVSAIRNYHHCILNAKLVAQLTENGLSFLLNGGSIDNGAEFEATSSCSQDEGCQKRNFRKEANDLIAKCYNNLAQCILCGPPRQREDYLRAAFYCDSVLKIIGDDDRQLKEKALFRKASALMKAEKYDKAIEFFELCLDNSSARQLAEECRQKENDDRRRRDAEIRANFARVRAADQANAPMMNGGVH